MSVTLVGLGIFLVLGPIKSTDFYILGPFAILFFGFCTAFGLYKLCKTKNGLFVNRRGITNNTSGVFTGIVLWSDIEKLEVVKVHKQNFIMPLLSNPQDYFARVKNPYKRMIMKYNLKYYGSPISISEALLKTNFNDLHELLQTKFNQYK